MIYYYYFISILLMCFLNKFTASFMVQNETGAMMYLERFGYLSMEDMSPEMGMKEAQPMLMAFQKMCNINQTGELDTKTMEMMNVARCGNKDMIRIPVDESEVSSNRIRRYMINQHDLKWRKRELTYKMGMYSSKMQQHVTSEQVLEAIKQAFFLWSEVTNLDFIHKQYETKVDIELSFTTRDHMQDGYPFDGPGKVLAHAFPPGDDIGGDVHFEDEEEWRVHSPKGTDVLFVAVHEIGHALGLSHSSTKGAIMAAFYGGYKPQLKLHPDDIEGIQAMYGKREIPLSKPTSKVHTPIITTSKPTITTRRWLPPLTVRTTTERWVPPKPIPTTTERWVPPKPTPSTTERWVPPKPTPTTTERWVTPKPITTTTERWVIVAETTRKPLNPDNFPYKSPKYQAAERPDLCSDSGSIDAITTINDGTIYAFKGNYVFKIDSKGQGIVPGWPHHIGSVFQGLDGHIDAAATRENGKTYFFKGGLYWRFIGTKMEPGYPKKISQHFVGIPDYIDSAFVWFSQFYFTKGDKFWRFDPKRRPHVANYYPLPIKVWGLEAGEVIDAAFMSPQPQGEIFFFSNSVYYRFDQRTFKIADASPSYPRSSKVMWFGCTAYRPDFRNIRQPQAISLHDNGYSDQNEYDKK